MVARVAAQGGLILYEPGAIVGHRVAPSRLTRKWFWDRCFWGNVTGPRMWPDDQVRGYELVRATWHVALMTWRAAKSGWRSGPQSAECFQSLLSAVSRAGLWVGLVGEAAETRRLLGPASSRDHLARRPKARSGQPSSIRIILPRRIARASLSAAGLACCFVNALSRTPAPNRPGQTRSFPPFSSS